MKDLIETELAWIAGLLEGEGCFSLKIKMKQGGEYPAMEVRCNMTDKDVVYRLYELCGGHFRGPIQPKRLSPSGGLPKQQWLWTIGRKAGCEDLLRQLLPYMGERRSARIREILEAGEKCPARRSWRHGRWAWEAKLCNCDECRKAYNKHMREYRARRKAREMEDE